MTDRRLSGRCPHTCCLAPDEPDHLHLFDPSVCHDCHALEASVARHPTNHRKELEP